MPKIPSITNNKKAICLSILCFAVYTVSYIGRLNYSGVMAEMIADGFISKTQGSFIATAFFLCYGCGQLINGIIADRSNPVKQISIGVLGATVANYLMSISGSNIQMTVIWAFNGYFQSLIWGPVFILVTQSIPVHLRHKSILMVNSASAAGAALSYAFTGFVLKYVTWRRTFFLSSLCLLAMLLIWMVGCYFVCRHEGVIENVKKDEQENKQGQPITTRELCRIFIISGILYMLIPAMIHGMLKDGITTWLPTYITEVFTLSAHLSVLISTVVPLFNILGATFAYIFMNKFKNEMKVIILFFSVSCLSLICLLLFGKEELIFTIILFAMVTASMMGVNAILCSNIPTHFARQGISATVSGLFNACGYLGTAISMYFIAYLSDSYGWNIVNEIWILSCILGVILTFMALKKWRQLLAAEAKQ